MITFSGNLFFNTDVPCCLWFFTNDKTKNGRDRRSETLFINATGCSTTIEGSRKHKELTQDKIELIGLTVSKWRTGKGYEDIKGFCKSSTLAEIEKNGFALTPGRYVGIEDVYHDDLGFDERINALKSIYNDLVDESDELNKSIKLIFDKLNCESE